MKQENVPLTWGLDVISWFCTWTSFTSQITISSCSSTSLDYSTWFYTPCPPDGWYAGNSQKVCQGPGNLSKRGGSGPKKFSSWGSLSSIPVVAASASAAERSVKTKESLTPQIPQGSSLFCKLLQRSCLVGHALPNTLIGSKCYSNIWWFPSNFCEPYEILTHVCNI